MWLFRRIMAEKPQLVNNSPEDTETDECMSTYTHIYSPDLLIDQVAFITGGGSGIGFRIAEVLMRHGCDTVIASRNLEKLTEAAKKLSSTTGRRCLPIAVDVRQPETISAAMDETLKTFGRVDILINNAAGNFLCPATSLSFNAFKTVMEIDTMGTFNTSKVVYDKWFKDHGGSIVNISATLGYRGQALQVHAGSAKAANDAMTRHLAVEWGPSGVRVNTVAPGPISGTEGYRRLGKTSRVCVCVCSLTVVSLCLSFSLSLLLFQVVHTPSQQVFSAASRCREPAIRPRSHMRFFSWPAVRLHTSPALYWSPTEGRGSPRPMTWNGCWVFGLQRKERINSMNRG
uniref:Peroxisomal 2,4-dienoyl-CoA reductase [(3E)-enoyl-CoA-producing] n=1 Tax=Cyprinus carpio TaxID=7962 RepID=A0A8C2H1G2_CYPCA